MVADQAWSEVAEARTSLCWHHGEPHDTAALLLYKQLGSWYMTHTLLVCHLQAAHIHALTHCGKPYDTAVFVK